MTTENETHIPVGWKSNKLGAICKVQKGVQFNKIELAEYGLYPCINGGIEPSGYSDLWNTNEDTITISEGGNSCGYVNFQRTKFWCGGHCYTLLNVQDGLDYEFLFWALKGKQDLIMDLRVGSGLPNIQQKAIKEFSFISPTSPTEQQKIASILSKLDEAITQTEQLIAKYKKIKEGLMHDLLTRGIDEQGNIRSEETHKFKDSPLGRIPEKWDYGSLSTIYELRTGTTPLRANENYFSEKGYNWAKTLDLNEYYINSTEEKVTDLALERTSLKLMPKDTILVAMYGGWEQIGRTSILNVEAGTNQAIVSLCNPKIQLQAEFTLFFLQENRWRWKQYAVSTRKDPNITKDDVANFIIAHPKCEKEQKDIVRIIQKVHNQIDLYKEQYLKYNLQKSGLMHDLLTGKIRVQI